VSAQQQHEIDEDIIKKLINTQLKKKDTLKIQEAAALKNKNQLDKKIGDQPFISPKRPICLQYHFVLRTVFFLKELYWRLIESSRAKRHKIKPPENPKITEDPSSQKIVKQYEGMQQKTNNPTGELLVDTRGLKI